MSKNFGISLLMVMTVGFTLHLLALRVDAYNPERKLCRAVIKMEGIPTSLVNEVHGKVYSFETDVLNGDSEWPLEAKDGVISANITLPREFTYNETPFNIQTAFLAKTPDGMLRCAGEVNVMHPNQLKDTIVLHSTCETAL